MLLPKKNEARGDRTVQGQAIRDGELFVEYTDKPLSGWGGLAVFFEFVEQTGFFRLLEQVFPEKKTSPNFVSSGDIVKVLFATVLVGGNRFAHVERVREDQVIQNLIGAARMGSADTVRRLFLGLTRGESQTIYESLHTFSTKLLFDHVQEDVLDLDGAAVDFAPPPLSSPPPPQPASTATQLAATIQALAVIVSSSLPAVRPCPGAEP